MNNFEDYKVHIQYTFKFRFDRQDEKPNIDCP